MQNPARPADGLQLADVDMGGPLDLERRSDALCRGYSRLCAPPEKRFPTPVWKSGANRKRFPTPLWKSGDDRKRFPTPTQWIVYGSWRANGAISTSKCSPSSVTI